MANPRKFSEKIALHNQKQAEETAAFEKIMREVSDATAKVNANAAVTQVTTSCTTTTKHKQLNSGDTLRIQSLGSFRGGSLPNVSAPQTELPKVEDLKPDDATLADFGLAGISDFEESVNHQTSYRESRVRSVGGPIRQRPLDRKIDTSPYGNNATYLSPPPDSSWRRTHSDSALHQSVQGQDNMHSHGHGLMSQAAQRRGMDNHSDQMHQQNHLQDGRPRSSCEVPRVPGINIYPSAHDPSAIQIPIGNNTGSLPDLTSVHFPSPLPTPLDQEHDHSSSPYSSSPVTPSPTTLSPTSLPTRQPDARFQFSPQHSPQGQSGHSPSRIHTILQDSGGYSPTHGQSQRHLSVPVNSRYLHLNKGVTLENNLSQGYISQQNARQYNVQSNSGGLVYTSQMSPRSPSIHGSHGNINLSHSPTYSFQQMQQQGSGYRSPGLRPSPGSSPGLGISTGVADAGHSAPCSPRGATHTAPYDPGSFNTPNTGNNEGGYYFTPALLQQHFEQFSMDWVQLVQNVQSLVDSGCTWTAQVQMDTPVPTSLDYINSHSPGQTHFTQSAVSAEDVASLVNAELGQDPGYYSTSPSTLHYNQQDNTPRQTTPQTPNTPTSIPNIILTDFSNTAAGAELSKELNSAITGHFDHEFFPSDESLREGLDPIDFDGLQMLTESDMNVDPTAEDAFRLDRL